MNTETQENTAAQEAGPMPSPGRIVHFRDEDGSVYPAIVATVHSPRCINLHVFRDDFDGRPQHSVETSVEIEDQGAEAAQNFRWFWPPRV